MRDYKKKLQRYKLDKERYNYLRALCKDPGRADLVNQAIEAIGEPGLSDYVRHHVIHSWKWQRLTAAGIPCSSDAFRIYRARFFWFLDSIEKGTYKPFFDPTETRQNTNNKGIQMKKHEVQVTFVFDDKTYNKIKRTTELIKKTTGDYSYNMADEIVSLVYIGMKHGLFYREKKGK